LFFLPCEKWNLLAYMTSLCHKRTKKIKKCPCKKDFFLYSMFLDHKTMKIGLNGTRITYFFLFFIFIFNPSIKLKAQQGKKKKKKKQKLHSHTKRYKKWGKKPSNTRFSNFFPPLYARTGKMMKKASPKKYIYIIYSFHLKVTRTKKINEKKEERDDGLTVKWRSTGIFPYHKVSFSSFYSENAMITLIHPFLNPVQE